MLTDTELPPTEDDGIAGLVLVGGIPPLDRLDEVVRRTGVRLAVSPELGDFADVEPLDLPPGATPGEVVAAVAAGVTRWAAVAGSNVVAVVLVGEATQAQPVLDLLEQWLPAQRQIVGCVVAGPAVEGNPAEEERHLVSRLVEAIEQVREHALLQRVGTSAAGLRDTAELLRLRAAEVADATAPDLTAATTLATDPSDAVTGSSGAAMDGDDADPTTDLTADLTADADADADADAVAVAVAVAVAAPQAPTMPGDEPTVPDGNGGSGEPVDGDAGSSVGSDAARPAAPSRLRRLLPRRTGASGPPAALLPPAPAVMLRVPVWVALTPGGTHGSDVVKRAQRTVRNLDDRLARQQRAEFWLRCVDDLSASSSALRPAGRLDRGSPSGVAVDDIALLFEHLHLVIGRDLAALGRVAAVDGRPELVLLAAGAPWPDAVTLDAFRLLLSTVRVTWLLLEPVADLFSPSLLAGRTRLLTWHREVVDDLVESLLVDLAPTEEPDRSVEGDEPG